MTAVEVVLILIGVVFLICSFFITEKLSPSEISRVSELSAEELRIVMDRELGTAGAKISDMVDNAVDLSMDQIQRTMERDCNEKIMAISEYSNSAMEQLKKINNEVTFLYSMLGDKHKELSESMKQLQELLAEYEELKSRPVPTQAPVVIEKQEETPAEAVQTQAQAPEAENAQESTQEEEPPETEEKLSAREEVLERYRAGEELKDIARDMNLGYGEVKLIVELYKGVRNL